MRCGCPECGSYMIQSEGVALGCVCSACGFRCQACLGTESVISREDILKLKNSPPLFSEEGGGLVREIPITKRVGKAFAPPREKPRHDPFDMPRVGRDVEEHRPVETDE